MAEFSIDRFVDRYAERTAGMSASEVRALFAVASRPEVVSLAGGMPFVVEAPSYVGALTAFAAYQPRFLTLETDDDGMIVEQLEQAIVRGERPTFVYTVPNFGNPAGVTMSGPRREHLVSLCREAAIPIVEDNPYGLLRFEGEPLLCLRSLDPHNVIYLGT